MSTYSSDEIVRDAHGRILPGQRALNPLGRPKSKTMKEYSREWFLQLTDEQKTAYILALEEKRPGFAWTMAEGNPEESKRLSITVPRPILGGASQPPALDAPETSEEVGRAIEGEVLEDTSA